MGRVRTLMTKKMAKNLVEKYGDKFTDDFSKNKETLKQILRIRSKKLRNILAGYIASLVAKSKESS
ncbi:MAG: 30S ribosomal protein S17e [Candidatus Aenigmarchaeota archaeon]|nr:30S ribosomal protein S17e [Candidatus Aenigmarchaeota archaeon]